MEEKKENLYEKYEKEQEQIKIIRAIGDRLLKIANKNINEKEVPSKETLDTFKIALSIIVNMN